MYLAVAFMFACTGTFSKPILEAGLSPVRMTEVRAAGSALLLLVIILAWRPRSLALSLKEIPFLAAYGVIAFALTQVLYFTTLQRLPVGIATLLLYLAPVIVAVWLRARHRQQGGRGIWLALALVLGGLALVSQAWEGAVVDWIGILAGVGTAFALATYWLLGERGSRTRDPLSLTFWGFAFATVAWSIVAPWWSFPWEVLGRSTSLLGGRVDNAPAWALLLYVLVLGTVVPFLLVLGSLRRIGAQRAGIIGTTEPIWATLLAFVFLGETIAGIQILGGVIVIAGIIMAELTTRQRTADSTGIDTARGLP